MKNCRIVIFVTKCTEKVVKYLYFHGKIAVFQNPQERARGNQSLRPCFSGSPDPNGPQKFCEMLVTVFEASKVLCLAVQPPFTNCDFPLKYAPFRQESWFTHCRHDETLA